MSTWGKFNPNQLPKKNWELPEAKEKLESYCAYQERCIWEVRRKLSFKGISGIPAENLIESLISEGYVDEKRFARSFARGKFRLKKWGRGKITRELRLRELSLTDIREGLAEIDAAEYYDTLWSLSEKTWEKTKENDPYKKRNKVLQRLISKGFEESMIREILENIQSQ
jgi:regulatory protein